MNYELQIAMDIVKENFSISKKENNCIISNHELGYSGTSIQNAKVNLARTRLMAKLSTILYIYIYLKDGQLTFCNINK